MLSLTEYIFEKNLGNVKRDIKFDISIGTTKHADERKTRHGIDKINIIEDEEIYDLIRRASDQIIDGLVYDKININDKDSGRFCIQDTYTELNIVGSVSGKMTDDILKINVITVYRGKDFRNNPNRTYTIKL